VGLAATLTTNALWALGAFVLLYGTGHRLWYLVRGEDRSLSQDIVMSTSIGLATFSYLLLGMSLLGQYRHAAILALSIALLAAGLFPAGRMSASILRADWRDVLRSNGWPMAGFALLTGVEFVRSCLPYTDNDTYHYGLPLRWLQNGVMSDTGSTLYDGLTHAIHLVFGAGLALGGDAAANKISLIAFVVCLTGCVALARAAAWGSRTGVYAAAILAAVHSFAAEGGEGGLVDIHVVLFTIAAGITGFRWLSDGRLTDALIFATMLAVAAGTKQYGWLVAGSFMLAVFVAGLATGRACKAIRAAPWAAVALLLLGAPWLYWSFAVTGNPLYPAFGPSMDSIGLHGVSWAEEATSRGFRRDVVAYVTYPWHLSMDFTLLRSSWSYGIGPAMIAFAPLALFYRQKGTALVASGLFLLFYQSVMFFIAPQMVRYLMPSLALAALIAANAADAFQRTNRSSAAIQRVVPALVLAPVLLAAGIEAGRLTPSQARSYLLGASSADQYRAGHHNLPGYALVLEANELLPPDARVLVLGLTGYRLDSSCTEWPRFLMDGLGGKPPTPQTVARATERLKITHIISSTGPERIAHALLEMRSTRDTMLAHSEPPPGYPLSALEPYLSESADGSAAIGSLGDAEAKRPAEAGAMLLVVLRDHLRLLRSSESVPFGYVYAVAPLSEETAG